MTKAPDVAAYDAFMRHALGGHPSVVLVASTLPLESHRDTYRIIWHEVARAVLATASPLTGDGEPLSSVSHPEVLSPGVSIISVEIEMPERPETMLQRVARQVYNNVGKQLTVEEEARRILEAIRDIIHDKDIWRPIQEAMWAEAKDIEKADVEGRPWDFRGNDVLAAQWRAAFDAALKEPT